MTRANAIIDAFAARQLIPLLTDGDADFDEDAAYAVAAEIHAHRLARGERPVGRKIGFTNRGIWAQYNVSAPIWAHMYDTTVSACANDRAVVAIGGLVQPRVEPEIQLHFVSTPPATHDEEAILKCIDWIALGFEIVHCPFPDWRFRGPDAIAACGVHGLLVTGPQVAVDDIENCAAKLHTFTMTLSRNGEPVATGNGANVLDSPLLAFAHLADVLAAQSRFPPVQAGEIITTGTLTELFPALAGDTWTTSVQGIDLPGMTLRLEDR